MTSDVAHITSNDRRQSTVTQLGRDSARETIKLQGGHSVDLEWASLTDTGMRREVNEDSVVSDTPIFAVADGMGGHAAGDVASAAVVNRLASLAGRDEATVTEINTALAEAVVDMDKQAGTTDEGSGTTVTGVAVSSLEGEPCWLVYNIGDSRVYRLKDGLLEQLTVDHSVVQELVDAGQITRDEADTHPHANVITRAVGFHEAPIPDYRTIPIEAGTSLLVCSDGLTKELTSYGLRHFMAADTDAAHTVRSMVEAALGNGGRDNVTMIVLKVHGVT